MKLTGKCKEEFNEYYDEMRWNLDDMDFKNLPESCQNAIIIEFFDSVGIYISIHYETFGNHYFNAMVTRNHLTTNLRTDSISRTEATNAAIIKANEIYNENN